MSAQEALAITGLGMVTPVGLSVESSCAAFRAGIARLGPVMGHLIDGPDGDPIPASGGRVPFEWFDGGPPESEFPGHEAFGLPSPAPDHLHIPDGGHRLLELALPAADEAWREAELAAHASAQMGLYLGLAEEDDEAALAEQLASALRARFKVVRADRFGRAAGLAALHRAARHLREGRIEIALVGGIDSRIRPSVIRQMFEAGTLKCEDHPNGTSPAEGAAFLVLERSAPTGRRPVGWLIGSAVGEEPSVGTEDANEGVGLTRVLRNVRAAAGGAPKHFPRVVCDLNGDRYRALEWMYASMRALQDAHSTESGPATSERWHPAECIGDPGAASGIINVIWSLKAMQRGYAGTDTSLVWGASEGVLRAAALLSRSEER